VSFDSESLSIDERSKDERVSQGHLACVQPAERIKTHVHRRTQCRIQR
jgi:hypothetical protein